MLSGGVRFSGQEIVDQRFHVRRCRTKRGRVVSGSGTRIASISGLRGVVGDGLDPAVAVEFAAAYASECEPGPIVVGHDGRVSSSVFAAAVQAGVMATGHDVLMTGATATPTIGVLVRDTQPPAEFRSRRRTIRLSTMASSSFSRRAWS